MVTLKIHKNNCEQGFVLIAAMVFLLALTLLGILAMNNSVFERILGGNERLQTDTFYKADSGIAAAIGLLGLNIELKGFSAGEAGAVGGIGFDAAYTSTPTFYMQPDPTLFNFFTTQCTAANGYPQKAPASNPVSITNPNDITDQGIGLFLGQHALGLDPVGVNGGGVIYRDAFYPRNNPLGGVTGQPPTTSIKIDAQDTTFAAGSATQSNEGYHGLGSGVASGGAQKIYDLRSRHDNINNAVAQMHIQWRHIIK